MVWLILKRLIHYHDPQRYPAGDHQQRHEDG